MRRGFIRVFIFPFMDSLKNLASVLTMLGCPPEKSLEMAAQLDKRARQLSEQKEKTYEEAMAHLLALMKQGWAAKEKGL
jgi:hypothetical protein